MKSTHDLIGGDRYLFDFHYCQAASGWAQLDTKEDASYYGNWANPLELKVVHFVEGDVTVYECETPDEFVTHIQDFRSSCDSLGYGPMRADTLGQEPITNAFRALGLESILYPGDRHAHS